MSLTKIGMYTFAVDRDANKTQVKKMVQDKFKVDVLGVRVINLHSKTKIQKTRKGKFLTSPLKKAIVFLKKGQKIALFEQVVDQPEAVVTTAEGEPVTKIKEKKSLLRGTKVKIEKTPRGQDDLKTSHKEAKKGTK